MLYFYNTGEGKMTGTSVLLVKLRSATLLIRRLRHREGSCHRVVHCSQSPTEVALMTFQLRFYGSLRVELLWLYTSMLSLFSGTPWLFVRVLYVYCH